MVRILSIFDIDDFEIEKYFLKFYTREIIDRFQKSSSRREPREQNEEHESNSNTNGELISYMEETPISF
ncbi:hypothetical protein IKI14_00915 [bacterium]|nr:hypothetical protein [bacterium]